MLHKIWELLEYKFLMPRRITVFLTAIFKESGINYWAESFYNLPNRINYQTKRIQKFLLRWILSLEVLCFLKRKCFRRSEVLILIFFCIMKKQMLVTV